jgi:hypothetical protein
MIISLYIMFAIIGFLCLFLAIFYNEDVKNLYLWPISIIIFSSLFFASYNLQTSTTVVASENVTLIDATHSFTTYAYDKDTTYFREIPFSYMFLGLALLSLVLFTWDLWSKYKA